MLGWGAQPVFLRILGCRGRGRETGWSRDWLPAGVHHREQPTPVPGPPGAAPPPRLRSHSPGRPPKCRGTGVLSEGCSMGPRVWLLRESTSSRRAVLLLVTVGHRLLVAGLRGPLTSRRAKGPTQCLASAASSSESLPGSLLCRSRAAGCQESGRGTGGPAHLSVGATARHTAPWRVSPTWRTCLHHRLHTAGPGWGLDIRRALPTPILPFGHSPPTFDVPASPAPAALGRGAPGTGPGGR